MNRAIIALAVLVGCTETDTTETTDNMTPETTETTTANTETTTTDGTNTTGTDNDGTDTPVEKTKMIDTTNTINNESAVSSD